MDRQDLELEELVIAVAMCLALQSLDLVVGSLHGTRADGMIVVSCFRRKWTNAISELR
jgi:hypothetical protein